MYVCMYVGMCVYSHLNIFVTGLIFDLENVVLDTKPVYWPACQVLHSGLMYAWLLCLLVS